MKRAALVAVLACIAATFFPVRAEAQWTGIVNDLRVVLRARTDAVRTKDRAAYAATIDPQAQATFRDAQLRSFDNLVGLPIARINYTIRAEEPDLTRGVDRSQYGDAERVALVNTTRALRFTYDDRSSLDSLFWTFVKRDGRWYVGGDDDVADLGLETTVSMWDLGAVVVEETEHFQVLARPSQSARARELAGLAEQSLATVGAHWTLPWSGKLVSFLPGSPAELADLIQASVDVTKYVAFVGYGYDPDSLRTTVPRLYVQDANLGGYAPAGQIETLVHELTHAAGSEHAGPFIPVWVHEGLADWVASGTANRYPRGSGAGARAPLDHEFGAGSQAEIVRAYRDARSLVAALSRIAGPDAPFRLFQLLGGDKVRPGSTPYVVDEALRSLGVGDLAALEKEWVGGR